MSWVRLKLGCEHRAQSPDLGVILGAVSPGRAMPPPSKTLHHDPLGLCHLLLQGFPIWLRGKRRDRGSFVPLEQTVEGVYLQRALPN